MLWGLGEQERSPSLELTINHKSSQIYPVKNPCGPSDNQIL